MMQFAQYACWPQDVWDLLRNLLSLSHTANILRKGGIWPEANDKIGLPSLDLWTILAHFCLDYSCIDMSYIKSNNNNKKKAGKM